MTSLPTSRAAWDVHSFAFPMGSKTTRRIRVYSTVFSDCLSSSPAKINGPLINVENCTNSLVRSAKILPDGNIFNCNFTKTG